MNKLMALGSLKSKLLRWMLLACLFYAAASWFPWYSEQLFVRLADKLPIGSLRTSVLGTVEKQRLIRVESTVKEGTAECVTIVFIGTTDPPRRIKLFFHDNRLLRREIEGRLTPAHLQEFNWVSSYSRYLFRFIAGCFVILLSAHLLASKRAVISRVIGVGALVVSGVVLAIDAMWLAIVYVRYAILLIR